jgi:hypothetical protein
MKELFRDKNGKLSSKRVIGFALTMVALGAGFAGAFVQNAMLVDFAKWIIAAGGLEIIAGVAERKE